MEEDINYLKYGIKELEGSYELHNREWAKSILQEMKNSLEHLIKAYKELKENSIPVSLVEETIEELKEIADEDNKEEYIKIEVLQELLEKRK